MDATIPKYSKARFEEIMNQMSAYLKKVGYNPNNIQFIPISGFNGDNLTERSTNLEWHSGPTLLQAVDNLKPAKIRSHADKPLRLPLIDAYKIRGTTVAIGRVNSGLLKPGMNITFAPSGLTARVDSVEIHHRAVLEAGPGDIVGFSVEGLEVGELARGQVVCDSSREPAKAVASFIAKVVVVDHDGGICKGYAPVLDCHAAHVAVKFVELVSKIDRRTGKEVEKASVILKNGEAGIVKMVPTRPLVVEAFSRYPRLGRFSVRDMSTTEAWSVFA